MDLLAILNEIKIKDVRNSKIFYDKPKISNDGANVIDRIGIEVELYFSENYFDNMEYDESDGYEIYYELEEPILNRYWGDSDKHYEYYKYYFLDKEEYNSK